MKDRERVRKGIESALEAIPDDILDVEARESAAVTWPIASYKTSEGAVTHFHAFMPEYCTARYLLDVAGYGRTGGDGEVELSLNEFHCLDVPAGPGGTELRYENPINVVVTSRARTPVFLAARARIGPGQNISQDVVITVSSWDAGGSPAGQVLFNWRCLVPTRSEQG